MGGSQDSIVSQNVIEDIDENIVSKPMAPDDEEADTDLETDRLLGQQRLDDQCFNEDRVIAHFCAPKNFAYFCFRFSAE